MIKGWQIYTWSEEEGEWFYWDSHINPRLLAEACNDLGLRHQRVRIKEVNVNEENK